MNTLPVSLIEAHTSAGVMFVPENEMSLSHWKGEKKTLVVNGTTLTYSAKGEESTPQIVDNTLLIKGLTGNNSIVIFVPVDTLCVITVLTGIFAHCIVRVPVLFNDLSCVDISGTNERACYTLLSQIKTQNNPGLTLKYCDAILHSEGNQIFGCDFEKTSVNLSGSAKRVTVNAKQSTVKMTDMDVEDLLIRRIESKIDVR